MPPLLTYVARVSDGLPLVASFAPTQDNVEEQKRQSKDILRGLNSNNRPVAKMSIETTQGRIFHYLIQENTVYLTCTEQSYPKRLAFLYLEEVADIFLEFLTHNHGANYRSVIETAARPYAFIQADPIIQRKQREFVDPKSSMNTNKLNQDLSDIHSIMRQNINQVLDRGEKIEAVGQISSNLMSESKKFKWGAKKLNWWAKINTYAPVAALTLLALVAFYLKFLH
mmetsp:Transcript_4886/g.5969  ORF Transcript_4886/g.5969 Transcript_4886/m.5969 type:complete len:226 (+) Transcript_4886:170-847(+)|eukprot:CAMPEP_0203642730 /NCGR_PEP_ID=MMETSP0088-20131115/8131_1 /ASSEMBLY_ACC=CAM_ASM_001087 /TAXON_ID=426623 /ORGANISM="Chaetoceros affinis, Strain CCMP159" /LENGTH=225 /DNA_ID=CAMNT_0050498655 /DNA_START=115 /DNA_END=792 /DNA_ORIENTATION=-